jgi:hypothetical protein
MRVPNSPDPFARSRVGLWRAGAVMLALLMVSLWLTT